MTLNLYSQQWQSYVSILDTCMISSKGAATAEVIFNKMDPVLHVSKHNYNTMNQLCHFQ